MLYEFIDSFNNFVSFLSLLFVFLKMIYIIGLIIYNSRNIRENVSKCLEEYKMFLYIKCVKYR